MTFRHGLRLQAPDGKLRETDCANSEGKEYSILTAEIARAARSPQRAVLHNIRQCIH